MKKLLLSLSLLFIIGAASGQLSNGSFETWNSTPYEEPTGWETGNHESISLGLVPVTRTNGPSGYAVRMETMITNGDTAHAYISNGDPTSGRGGVPFAEMPTAITGACRYNLQGNDTALIIVLFKSNGIVIDENIIKIHGTGSQVNWASFSYPLTSTNMPDSVIIAATCSNLLDNVGIENGSYLELDAIAFANASTPIVNNNFENWTSLSSDVITGWESWGDGVARITDAYDGTYALSLTTMDYGNGNINSSGLTNGHNTQSGPYGGMPYTLTADTLTGYYKYFASGSDSATIYVALLHNSNYVGTHAKLLAPAGQYTYFELPISSFSTPDTMRIDISSSKWPYTQTSVGSVLYLDHLQLKSEIAAGIKNVTEKTSNAFAFPNPASEQLHITLAKNSSENVTVEIFDLSGRLILKEKKSVTDNSFDLRISSLKSGRYYYRVTGNEGHFEQPFSKE